MNTPRIDRIDKNYFINGACEYFQVSTSAAIPSSYDYAGPDMFECEEDGSWTSPVISRSTNKVGIRSRRSIRMNGTAGALSDEFRLKIKVESIFAIDLANDVFSLGCKLKSDNFTQVRIVVSYADVEDDFSSVTQMTEQTFNFIADNSQQDVKFENITTNPNVMNGLQVEFEFKGLTTAAAADLYVGEFICNIGDAVNDYTPSGRDLSEEFELCQRYLEKSYDIPTSLGTGTFSGVSSLRGISGAPFVSEQFASAKRSIPTITLYDVAGNANRIRANGVDNVVLNGTIASTRQGFQVPHNTSVSEIFFHWVADSRL